MAIWFGPMGLGVPGIMVILLLGAFLLGLPTLAVVFVVRMLSGRKNAIDHLSSGVCPHCRQAIPWIGSFCCFCGSPIRSTGPSPSGI